MVKIATMRDWSIGNKKNVPSNVNSSRRDKNQKREANNKCVSVYIDTSWGIVGNIDLSINIGEMSSF